jgi:hypothetical protein
MNVRHTVSLAAAVMLFAVSGLAQTAVSTQPGYFPIEQLELFTPDSLNVDIDLQGPMLRLVAGAMAGAEDGEDRQFAALMATLDRIRVRVGSFDGQDPAQVKRLVTGAADRLAGAGWQRILFAREDNELVNVFVRGDEKRFQGLTVLAVDGPDEIALINIVGDIDPSQLGRLLGDLDSIPGVGDLDLKVPATPTKGTP